MKNGAAATEALMKSRLVKFVIVFSYVIGYVIG